MSYRRTRTSLREEVVVVVVVVELVKGELRDLCKGTALVPLHWFRTAYSAEPGLDGFGLAVHQIHLAFRL